MIRPIWSAKAALPTTLPCTVTLTVMLGPPAIRRETSWGMILVPLGKSTISMQTDGRTRGQSESYSQNTQRLGRELMTPSELATMPGDRCILQLRGLPPFYSKKYDLKQHPNYKYTAEADKVKNAFDLNSLVTRRMDKLNPNETYTVYKVDVPDEALTGEDEDILNYDDVDDPDAFV